MMLARNCFCLSTPTPPHLCSAFLENRISYKSRIIIKPTVLVPLADFFVDLDFFTDAATTTSLDLNRNSAQPRTFVRILSPSSNNNRSHPAAQSYSIFKVAPFNQGPASHFIRRRISFLHGTLVTVKTKISEFCSAFSVEPA